MTKAEFQARIVSLVQVTSQKFIVAKGYLAAAKALQSGIATELLKLFLRHVAHPYPEPREAIVNGQTVDLAPKARYLAESISWQLAFHEALWALIHNGVLLVSDHSSTGTAHSVDLSYSERGGGEGIQLGDFEMWFQKGRIRRSHIDDGMQVIANPDLYLKEINIAGLHAPVKEALEEALRCFRQEFFLASAVMIGRAVEAALSELGKALSSAGLNPKAKLGSDEFLAEKIRTVTKAIESNEAKPILKKSNNSLDRFRDAIVWSQTVLDARNCIHYAVAP